MGASCEVQNIFVQSMRTEGEERKNNLHLGNTGFVSMRFLNSDKLCRKCSST